MIPRPALIWDKIIAAVGAVLVLGIALTYLTLHSNNKTTPNMFANRAAEKMPLGKMVSWDSRRDGSPRIYVADDLVLTLKLNTAVDPETKAKVPVATLVVRANNEQEITVMGESGDHDPGDTVEAMFGVGKFDKSNPAEQVIFSTFSGGNRPSEKMEILERNAEGWKTIDGPNDTGALSWLDFPKDIDGDGVPDFVISDDVFAGQFGPHATDFQPPSRIFNLRNGFFVDVSASGKFDKVFSADMVDARKYCLHSAVDVAQNAACATYVADGARLGQFKAAWQVMLSNYDRTSDIFPDGCKVRLLNGECPDEAKIKFDNYPQALAWFLTANGYTTPADFPGVSPVPTSSDLNGIAQQPGPQNGQAQSNESGYWVVVLVSINDLGNVHLQPGFTPFEHVRPPEAKEGCDAIAKSAASSHMFVVANPYARLQYQCWTDKKFGVVSDWIRRCRIFSVGCNEIANIILQPM